MLNASASKISACDRRFYMTVVKGWRNKVNTNDIEYGSGFHKFTSGVEEHPPEQAFALAMRDALDYFDKVPMDVKSKKKYLDRLHLIKTCSEWYNTFRSTDDFQILRVDGKPMCESTFEIPFYTQDDYSVVVCGTIDKVGKFPNGCWAIGDYKTTSSWEIDNYLEGYSLSVQLRFYLWAFLRHCQSAPLGSPLRNLTILNCGAFIDGIFLNGADKTTFKRSRMFLLKQADMDEFEGQLLAKAKHLVTLAKADRLPERTGIMVDACETKYGKCPFFGACASPDDVSFGHIVKQKMVQVDYNPLNFGKLV